MVILPATLQRVRLPSGNTSRTAAVHQQFPAAAAAAAILATAAAAAGVAAVPAAAISVDHNARFEGPSKGPDTAPREAPKGAPCVALGLHGILQEERSQGGDDKRRSGRREAYRDAFIYTLYMIYNGIQICI